VSGFRKKVKGWSANVDANLRRKKDRLKVEYTRLDILMESRPLSYQERDKMIQVDKELNTIWSIEEIKAR
jgi:hypothetical protein